MKVITDYWSVTEWIPTNLDGHEEQMDTNMFKWQMQAPKVIAMKSDNPTVTVWDTSMSSYKT